MRDIFFISLWQVGHSYPVQWPLSVGESPRQRSLPPTAGRRRDEHPIQPLQGWLEVSETMRERETEMKELVWQQGEIQLRHVIENSQRGRHDRWKPDRSCNSFSMHTWPFQSPKVTYVLFFKINNCATWSKNQKCWITFNVQLLCTKWNCYVWDYVKGDSCNLISCGISWDLSKQIL